METKKILKLKELLSDADFDRVMESIQLFCESYDHPAKNNDGINALIAFALETPYLQETLEHLGLDGIESTQALNIVFREYYKEFTKLVAPFRPALFEEELEAFTAIQRKAQSCYPGKDEKAIADWIYLKLRWYLDTCEEQVSKTIFLLSADKEKFKFGGLRSLGLNKEVAEKLLPMANGMGALMTTMKKKSQETSIGSAISDALSKKGLSMEQFIDSVDSSHSPSSEVPESNASEEPSSTSTELVAKVLTVETPLAKDIPNMDRDEFIEDFMTKLTNFYGVDQVKVILG